MQQRGHGHVVGQVGDQRGRLILHVALREVQDVVVQDREPADLAVRVLGDGLRQLTSQYRVDLDGGHTRPAVQQRQRQRPEAGTDLENVVVAVDPGCRHDPANGIGVMNEVLAERLTWSEVQFLRQMSDLGATEEPNRQRAPTLPLHTGQAPHP